LRGGSETCQSDLKAVSPELSILDLREVLKLEKYLGSRTQPAMYYSFSILTILGHLPWLDAIDVAAPECGAAVSIVELGGTFIDDGPYLKALAQSPTSAMQSNVGPIDCAAVASPLSVFSKQIVRILIEDIETDGLKNVSGCGRTLRISTMID
jgi:hypothetical protein